MDNLSISANKAYNRIGTALLATAAISIVLQLILSLLGQSIFGDNLADHRWYIYVMAFVPLYAVAFPVGTAIMRKVPSDNKSSSAFDAKDFFAFLIMCFPLMYAGNIIGTLLALLISGGTAANPVNEILLDSNPLKILVAVVLGPLLEEFLFRKQIIDRCAKYGEKSLILFSSVAFALFHMNLYQYFYAFGLGLIFSYVYIRTRRIIYPFIMHMIINFNGGVIAPLVISMFDSEALTQMSQGTADEAIILSQAPALAVTVLYGFVMIIISIMGIIFIFKKSRRLIFEPAPDEMSQGSHFKNVYLNAGVISFIIFCLGITAAQLLIVSRV